MTRQLCRYAILRFTPYVETGEFANVGVVVLAPKQGYFGFKLTRKYARITRFFDELDRKVFSAALKDMREEMERIQAVFKDRGFAMPVRPEDLAFANRVFEELVRPREVIVRFDLPRLVLARDPEALTKKLFEFYVGRNFVTKEYSEKILNREIGELLRKAGISNRFVERKVGDEHYQIKLPFAELQGGRVTRAIKPLCLNQQTPTEILNRGGTWCFALKELQKRRAKPDRLLFTLDGPKDDPLREEAFHETEEMLRECGAEVLPSKNSEEILDFASA